MFTLLPIRMLFTSPRTTALNHTLHSPPITTSPTTVALGATKQSSGITGAIPFTGNITGMVNFCLLENIILQYAIQRTEGILPAYLLSFFIGTAIVRYTHFIYPYTLHPRYLGSHLRLKTKPFFFQFNALYDFPLKRLVTC